MYMSIFECGKSSLNIAASNDFFKAREISIDRLQKKSRIKI